MTSEEVYQKALNLTLSYEGGYSNHPEDPGKATMRGITQSTFSAWLIGRGLPERDVREITDEEVKTIYRLYWEGVGGDRLPAGLAVVAFDIAVNSGTSRALRWMAEGADDPVSLTVRRMEHYTNLEELWPTFGRGWSRRAYGVLGVANQLERGQT